MVSRASRPTCFERESRLDRGLQRGSPDWRHDANSISGVRTPADLARARTGLDGEPFAHTQRLVASWQTLADLCFSDLLLLAPTEDGAGHRFVVLAQVRPTTGQTLYPVDMVGTVVDEVERPLVSRAWRLDDIVDGDSQVLGSKERVRVQAIPVRFRGEPVAVLMRETSTASGRRPGELERHYVDVFDRLARMVADGSFPFGQDEIEFEDAPRVGDGVIVVDAESRVEFASPNAVSSLHRMGIHAYTSGVRLAELGFDQDAVDSALRARVPVTEELERGDTEVIVRSVPLLDAGEPVGAVILLRDVSDIRRRDRMLLSKDATIREIHHRVKNNLQTIASLLRLQGRRLSSAEARQAIAESEQRIRSIAIVHESLSRDARDVVSFDDVVRPLLRVIAEAVSTSEAKITFEVEGDLGELPGEVATPLAVALNELLQNVVDHAFPVGDDEVAEGSVRIVLRRDASELSIDVIDDGVGLFESFSLDESKGLGLSIVQALITGELNGSIVLDDAGDGTHAALRVPLSPIAPVEV
jgi:two-component system, sensor histidine kinase PdtaS